MCHRFPDPKTDMHRLKTWVKIVFGVHKLSDEIAAIYYNKYVCDTHFTSDCLSPGTKRLKKNALPTLNIHRLQQCKGLCTDYIIFIGDFILFCTLLFI